MIFVQMLNVDIAIVCELNYVDFMGTYLKSLTLLKTDLDLQKQDRTNSEHSALGIGKKLFCVKQIHSWKFK